MHAHLTSVLVSDKPTEIVVDDAPLPTTAHNDSVPPKTPVVDELPSVHPLLVAIEEGDAALVRLLSVVRALLARAHCRVQLLRHAKRRIGERQRTWR